MLIDMSGFDRNLRITEGGPRASQLVSTIYPEWEYAVDYQIRDLAASHKPHIGVPNFEKLARMGPDVTDRPGSRNPLFLPKSLFDSYTVKSSGGEVTVEKIQTVAGAERKVRELARKYPCVGFEIRSRKFGSVVKAYAPVMRGSATLKVVTDNTQEYKREATDAAKDEAKFVLYVDGKEFATYDTRKEAEKAGKAEGRRWKVKEMRENPRTTPSDVAMTLTRQQALDAFGTSRNVGSIGSQVSHSVNTIGAARKLAKRYNGQIAQITTGSGEFVAYIVYSLRPTASNPRHPALSAYDRARQAETEAHLRTPEGEQARKDRNDTMLRGMRGKKNPLYDSHLSLKLEGPHGANQRYNVYDTATLNETPIGYVAKGANGWYARDMEGGDHGNWYTTFWHAAWQLQLGTGATRRNNPRKRNPEDADAFYEIFHGEAPTETLEVYTEEFERTNLTTLGYLIQLKVETTTGKLAELNAPDPETASSVEVVRLACSPDGKSMYLVGGDQSVPCETLGFIDKDERDFMVLGLVSEITYRTRKAFDRFEEIDYFHETGEETKVKTIADEFRRKPTLIYNPHDQTMRLAGGMYEVRDVGIVN